MYTLLFFFLSVLVIGGVLTDDILQSQINNLDVRVQHLERYILSKPSLRSPSVLQRNEAIYRKARSEKSAEPDLGDYFGALEKKAEREK